MSYAASLCGLYVVVIHFEKDRKCCDVATETSAYIGTNSFFRSGCQNLDDVVHLFRQVQSLQPSAMACPPNIWSGLYLLYRSYIDEIGVEMGRGTVSDHVGVAKTGKSTLVTVCDDARLSPKVGASRQQQALHLISAMFGPRIKFLVTGGGPTATAVRVDLMCILF